MRPSARLLPARPLLWLRPADYFAAGRRKMMPRSGSSESLHRMQQLAETSTVNPVHHKRVSSHRARPRRSHSSDNLLHQDPNYSTDSSIIRNASNTSLDRAGHGMPSSSSNEQLYEQQRPISGRGLSALPLVWPSTISPLHYIPGTQLDRRRPATAYSDQKVANRTIGLGDRKWSLNDGQTPTVAAYVYM